MHKFSYLDKNWLVIRLNNQTLIDHRGFIKGVVYDLGCGIRPYEVDIVKWADRYIGVDWSNTLHELRADIVSNLNEPLPIADESADTVVSFQVMEHLSEPQIMLAETFRILKANGNLLLTVPFQWSVHEEPYDFFRYTKYGLTHMLTKAGFVDISVSETTGFWFTWLLKLNYQLARLIRGPRFSRIFIRTLLTPIWFFNQLVAHFLDRFWSAPQETAGYVVTARKP